MNAGMNPLWMRKLINQSFIRASSSIQSDRSDQSRKDVYDSISDGGSSNGLIAWIGIAHFDVVSSDGTKSSPAKQDRT